VVQPVAAVANSLAIGTWWWMSPEALFGETELISAKSDVYSLAICMYEIFTHQLPYESDPSISTLPPVTIAIKVSSGLRPDLYRQVPEKTREKFPELIDIIAQCWDNEPSKRPSSMDIWTTLNAIWTRCEI
jgi:serine/threonine protein kinase